jgi:hypothetical protein
VSFLDLPQGERRQLIEQLRLALAYYANPETYANMFLMCDPPCGDVAYDDADLVAGRTPGAKPGQIARAAVAYAHERLGLGSPNWQEMPFEVDREFLASLGIDLIQRYDPPPPPQPQPGDEDYVERTECCGLELWEAKPFEAPADGVLPDQCPLCASPVYVGPYDDEPTDARKTYLCGANARACGHLTYPGFNFGQNCRYFQSLR